MVRERQLQLDCGNSGIKWRLMVGQQLQARGRISLSETAALPVSERVDVVCVASVLGDEHDSELAELLTQRFGRAPWFARSLPALGALRNSYAHPERMGVDRWLAMLAAYARQRGRCCVVDAGSALTIDLIAEDGRHEGGYIIPGAQLMEAALLQRTGRVRFAEPADWTLEPGRSTADAVRHGIALALSGAVRWAVERNSIAMNSLVFSGGYGALLAEQLDSGIWVEDLVFEGLAQQYQALVASPAPLV